MEPSYLFARSFLMTMQNNSTGKADVFQIQNLSNHASDGRWEEGIVGGMIVGFG